MGRQLDEAAILAMSEKKFAERVCAFLRSHGWHVQRNGWVGVGNQYMKGFPDLVCVREFVMFVELKTSTGKIREPQLDWGRWIQEAGGRWELWRPADLEYIKDTFK